MKDNEEWILEVLLTCVVCVPLLLAMVKAWRQWLRSTEKRGQPVSPDGKRVPRWRTILTAVGLWATTANVAVFCGLWVRKVIFFEATFPPVIYPVAWLLAIATIVVLLLGGGEGWGPAAASSFMLVVVWPFLALVGSR